MNGKLRILHVLETYPPGYGGGAAITTRDVCRALAALGHEVRVLCADMTDSNPYSIRREVDEGVRVERVNLPHLVGRDPDGWTDNIREWRAHGRRIDELIGRLLDDWRPDIVDYHTARPFGEECLPAIARCGIPLVATLHDSWLLCLRVVLRQSPTDALCGGPGVWKCVSCIYSHYTDRNTTRSLMKLPWRLLKLGAYPAWRYGRRVDARRVVQGAIARSGFIAGMHRPHINGPVVHIPLGVNLEEIPQARPVRPRHPLRFGFVGGFQPIKGIWQVLDAAEALKREGASFALHIWGPEGERGSQEIAARNLADCVFVRGMYKEEDRWRVYSEIDVALMATTVYEALGRVPLEAAAMGAPTIAPAVGGIRETIRDGIDGLHYRFRDVEDLTRQMRRILTDQGLLESLIANLPAPLDTRVQVAEVERFYRRVLDERVAVTG